MANFEPQHADIMSALRDLYQHQAFKDFTIHLKDGTAHISRILVAALSPFFRNMLTADMTETRTNNVAMDHITMETWTCIEEFYFGRQKLWSIDNVVDVLETSHMYQLDKLAQYCCDYLKSVCSPDNCLAIKRVAAKLQLEPLVKKASKVIAKNFSAVCKCEDFLFLEKTELLELLEKEELVTTEDDVCEALLAWMEAKDADEDTCTELFQHVRMEKLSDDYLGNGVLQNRMSTLTPALQVKVREEVATRFNLGQKRSRGVPRRRPIRDSDGTLVIVGHRSRDQLCLYQWSPSEKKWNCFPGPDGFCLQNASSATCDGTVYITGVREDIHRYRKTLLFDLHEKCWNEGPSLIYDRAYHAMAVIHDRVFVVGGIYSNSKYIEYIDSEEYSQTERKWTHAGELTIAAHSCGVAAFGDTILIVGGESSESNRLIQTFNVETRTAAVLNVRLPRSMHDVQAARLGNTAFFVGSRGDLIQITEMEGEFQLMSHAQLEEFGWKTWFGLQVTNTCVRVIGGGCSQFVVCWNHQGQKVENDEVGDLPEEINVLGVHEVNSSLL